MVPGTGPRTAPILLLPGSNGLAWPPGRPGRPDPCTGWPDLAGSWLLAPVTSGPGSWLLAATWLALAGSYSWPVVGPGLAWTVAGWLAWTVSRCQGAAPGSPW